MNRYYADILSRISEPPIWFDENAVPRFEAFSPSMVANIYADVCLLVEIQCQSCGTVFKVAMSEGEMDRFNRRWPLYALIKNKGLHYGDPPNINCCPSGPTMNCLDIRVLECWRRGTKTFEWERQAELEVELEDADAERR
jgi:hypothetical protein